MGHYDHIDSIITDFFKKMRFDVVIEPSGSRGPDIIDKNKRLVGEIKSEAEIERDLRGYWSQWNSEKTSFGGKTKDYLLSQHLPQEVVSLSMEAKGWIAVIYGQLRHYVNTYHLSEGWLIYEGNTAFGRGLSEAVNFLSKKGFIKSNAPEQIGNIGFMKITYLKL